MQDIGVLSWRRGTWVLPVLCVRAPGRSFATFWNRTLGLPPDVLVCDLLALGTTTARMSAVLPHYAESVWSPNRVRTTEVEAPREADDPTVIHGRAMSVRTLAAGVAALAVTATMISVYTAGGPQGGVFTVGAIMMVLTLYAAIGLSDLLTRSRCTLTADPVAVSVTIGGRTQHIEWQHISQAWIAQHDTRTRTKRDGEKVKTIHLVELELTEDGPAAPCLELPPLLPAQLRRDRAVPARRDHLHLNASVDTVEAALAPHADPNAGSRRDTCAIRTPAQYRHPTQRLRAGLVALEQHRQTGERNDVVGVGPSTAEGLHRVEHGRGQS